MPTPKSIAKVHRAAEAALADHGYVSAIDVLLGMHWLTPEDLLAWRRGRVPFLEGVVHANLHTLSETLKLYRKWAAGKSLMPGETVYRRFGRGPKHPLRFSKSGNPLLERAYRTHYVSPHVLRPARLTVTKRPAFHGHPDEITGLAWFEFWSPDEP